MLKRLLNLPLNQSFFLFGARGVGKTKLITSLFEGPDTFIIDLLQGSVFQELSLRPDSLENVILAKSGIKRVVIDEVQKIPSLLDVVHRMIENQPNIQFILTGSSARKLKRGGANLLAGRAFVFNLFPFTESELGPRFDLLEALHWGTLPKLFELQSAENRADYLRAYTLTYLKEEILQEQIIRRLEPFQRFLPVAAQSSGLIINFSKIGREVGVASQTVASYFQILSDTLVGFFLPAFHLSVRKQERSSPKFYLFDNGVQRALTRELESSLSPGTYSFGRMFENFIVQEIVRLSSYLRKDDQFYYYRTQAGLEVDLIIDRPSNKLILIEIKSADRILEEDVRQLNSIAKDLPHYEALCISNDLISKSFGKVISLHWKDALRHLGLR